MPILSNTSTDTNLPLSNPPNDSEYQSNSQWLEFAQATHSNTNFSPQSQSSLIPPNCYYCTWSTTAHINHYIAGAYQTLVQSQLQDPELLLNENQQLCMLITTLNSKVAALQAELDASNAHCMLVCRELNDVHQQLASQSKVRTQSTLKCKAWLVTTLELKTLFEAKEADRAEKKSTVVEWAACKVASKADCNSHIAQDIQLKVSENPLSSYRWKDDLVALAGTLGLSRAGTCTKLMDAIDSYLQMHPELGNNSHFSGLFSKWKCFTSSQLQAVWNSQDPQPTFVAKNSSALPQPELCYSIPFSSALVNPLTHGLPL